MGICLDFACSSTRTPHGAYVRMGGRDRIDPHWGVVERLGTRTRRGRRHALSRRARLHAHARTRAPTASAWWSAVRYCRTVASSTAQSGTSPVRSASPGPRPLPGAPPPRRRGQWTTRATAAIVAAAPAGAASPASPASPASTAPAPVAMLASDHVSRAERCGWSTSLSSTRTQSAV